MIYPTSLQPGKTVAILWYGKSVLVGVNDRIKTDPKCRRSFPDGVTKFSPHAEMNALMQLPRGFVASRVKLYVMRLTPGGKIGLAKPCAACAVWLEKYGIKPRNIWYTTDEGTFKRLDT